MSFLAAYVPHTDAVNGSLVLTALVALIPLATYFILLAGVKVSALWSGVGATVAAILISVIAMKMPLGLSVLSASQGFAYGLFPIMWIVVAAIWFYEVTVRAGRFEDLRVIFSNVGRGDMRIQAMLIAFCFGGLLEALAGFGAPVAITGVMLMAIGLKPLKAAVTVLVANTAPVAFGAMAIPITTAGGLTAASPEQARHQSEMIAAMVGHQSPLLALFVPLLLVFLVDGIRGLKQTWLVALVTGGTFAVLQWWCSNHFTYELTDVVAALGGFAVAAILMRFYKPTTPEDQQSHVEEVKLGGSRTWMALFPYVFVVLAFGVTKLWTLGMDLPAALKSTDIAVPWPWLNGQIYTAGGEVSASTIYSFSWLSSPGTTLLISGIVVSIVYSIWTHNGKFDLSFGHAIRGFWDTIVKMRISIVTVAFVLALAYVMNQSGQTIAIGQWLAATGTFFAFLSPMLGWLGTAVTGSDTSANALFAKLQQAAAHGAGINEHLLIGANTAGGVVGKLVSPQNLTIAATAVGEPGKERILLGKVIGYSLAMLLILCILVYLQATVFGWMIPTA